MHTDAFPIFIGKFRFIAYYQQGFLNKSAAEWKRDAAGPHHLVVCSCGRGVYAYSLDEAVHGLRNSFRFAETQEHYHVEAMTFICRIIAAAPGDDQVVRTIIILETDDPVSRSN